MLFVNKSFSLISSKNALLNARFQKIKALSTSSTPISAPKANDNTHFMKLALRLAQYAFRAKEVPIGAVIVDENGVVISTAGNQVESKNDASAHAEIECIRRASEYKNNWRLDGTTLYTTLEPCPMCMSAIQQARIKKVVFGASDSRLGAVGSWINLTEFKHPFHNTEVEGGILQVESVNFIKKFFLIRRKEGSKSPNSPFSDRGSDYLSSSVENKDNDSSS